ncbi:MAG: helix-turn-helix domain-containing protein [Candidatus Lokiarchaeota archaeon]|nr:helix-turn-helix domain-containing protein [Candidatus Lokiarchaeota archaeon]
MRILRLQISSEMVKKWGFSLFDQLEFLEIINVWQYSQTNFFSIQKLIFKKEYEAILDDLQKLKEKLSATYLQIIRKKDNEIVCILKQHRDSGFWPIILPGAWALVPPIIIDPDYILLTLVAPKEYIHNLFQMVKMFTEDYTVLAVERMNDVDHIEELLGVHNMPFPTFTDRQREIASYAVRNGFYHSPKKISAKSIADRKGISVSAVNEHLRKVEKVAMDYFFGEKISSTNKKKKKWFARPFSFLKRE